MVEKNTEDNENFVRRTAKEAASKPGDRRKYVKGRSSQEENVINRLLAKAGGIFRWVQLAFDLLHASVDYEAMSRRLDQLLHLRKLFDLYDETYDEMMGQVETADQRRIRTLLTFMLYGEYMVLARHIQNEPRELRGIAHVLEACEFPATKALSGAPTSIERVRTMCSSLAFTKAWNI